MRGRPGRRGEGTCDSNDFDAATAAAHLNPESRACCASACNYATFYVSSVHRVCVSVRVCVALCVLCICANLPRS